jgi:uncharacterized protein YodC (DUF2158 family)
MTTKDGGPAFPVHDFKDPAQALGMTLRDWFAGQALIGILADGVVGDVTDEDVANASYAMADAMLKAREQ